MQPIESVVPNDPRLAAKALDVAIVAARAAAEVIRDAAPRVGSLEWVEKTAADFVTEVDRAAETVIAELIGAAFPQAVVVGEELSALDALDSVGLTFVVDPLDGTTNFLHGFPHYAVSIGVMETGSLIAGVVLNVPRDDLFTASAGGGTFLNGVAVSVSDVEATNRALIGTGFPFKNHELLEGYARQFIEVSRHTAGIRRAGSAALDLADVACGRFDGFWELTLAPWDVAAGIILVREAGGVVTDLDSVEVSPVQGAYVAGNPAMHRWLMQAVHDASSLRV